MRLAKDFQDYKNNKHMNKFVLNFSDFVLNEIKQEHNISNYFTLNENAEDMRYATFEEVAYDRLKDKVKYFITDDGNIVNAIVSRSNGLISSANKVLTNQDNSNWFMKNISYLAVTALTIGGIYLLIKKGKIKNLGDKINNIVNRVKTISSTIGPKNKKIYNDISKEFKELEDAINIYQSELKKIGDKWKSKNIDIYNDFFKEEIEIFEKDITFNLFKSELEKIGKNVGSINRDVLENILNKLKSLKDTRNDGNNIEELFFYNEGQKYRHFLDSMEWKLKDKSYYALIDTKDKILKDDFEFLKTKYDNIKYELFENFKQKIINSLRDLPEIKISAEDITKKVDDVIIDIAEESNISDEISGVDEKGIKAFLPFLKSAGKIGGLGMSVYLISELIKKGTFIDIPEINRIFDISKNTKVSKEYYAKRIIDDVIQNKDDVDLMEYQQTLEKEIEIDSKKLKNPKYTKDLAIYISYYLADIMMEYQLNASSLLVYGIIRQKFQS
jgi:hypothetical protein